MAVDDVIVHAPQGALDPVIRAQLDRITALAWPGADAGHDPALAPELFARIVDGRVVAGLAVLSKSIEHAGRTWRAAGLSAVATDPGARRAGHAAAVCAAAREWLLADGADVGLFTCDRELAGVYTLAGWTVLPGSVLVGGTPSDPFPSDGPGMDKVVLAAGPEGHERLVRAAFSDTRIALHPGDIDRLW